MVIQPCLGQIPAFVLLVFLPCTAVVMATPPSTTLAPTPGDAEEEVLVKIRARQFVPDTVMLHAGHKTKLVFYNQDVELHAFVPVGLFDGMHLNIGGNGAPEFTAQGFKRVIVPSEGRAEFRFIPERPGVYPYFCDMPGHEMKATIVVQ
jgi:plastocyanin